MFFDTLRKIKAKLPRVEINEDEEKNNEQIVKPHKEDDVQSSVPIDI